MTKPTSCQPLHLNRRFADSKVPIAMFIYVALQARAARGGGGAGAEGCRCIAIQQLWTSR